MTPADRLRAAQRRSIETITQPGIDAAWGIPTLSPLASMYLTDAVALYRDNTTRLADDFAAAMMGVFGSPAVRAGILEKIAGKLLEGGV